MEHADSIWINLSGELTMKLLPALSLRVASLHRATYPTRRDNNAAHSRTPALVVARRRPKHYNCDHHGPNNTHDTRDCLVINGQQGGQPGNKVEQDKGPWYPS